MLFFVVVVVVVVFFFFFFFFFGGGAPLCHMWFMSSLRYGMSLSLNSPDITCWIQVKVMSDVTIYFYAACITEPYVAMSILWVKGHSCPLKDLMLSLIQNSDLHQRNIPKTSPTRTHGLTTHLHGNHPPPLTYWRTTWVPGKVKDAAWGLTAPITPSRGVIGSGVGWAQGEGGGVRGMALDP